MNEFSATNTTQMEIGTIIGDKAYSLQYIVDAPRYSEYLPVVRNMIHSLAINSSTRFLPGIGLCPELQKYGSLLIRYEDFCI
jgi:hypothetical protein